jgi:hypothetical protein
MARPAPPSSISMEASSAPFPFPVIPSVSHPRIFVKLR